MSVPTYLSGAIFMKAQKALRHTVTTTLRRHELTTTSWTMIGLIASSKNGIRLVEIAESLLVKAPLITNIAHEFISRGLISRVQHHEDARAKLLHITPKGVEFVYSVNQEVERELGKLLVNLTENDLETYKRVLETIIANATEHGL